MFLNVLGYPKGRVARRVVAFAWAAVLAGCASSPKSVTPLTQTQNNYLATEAERKLMTRSEQFHQEFIQRGLLVNDAQLTDYLNSVAARVRPQITGGPTFRYHLLKDPTLNAMALPDGNIYVTAGLAVRLESEDQLALVLAHETVHVVQRHGYKGSLDRQNTVVAAHVTDLLLAGTGLAYIPFGLDLASFSREQEKEADLLGLQYFNAASYNAEDGAKIFDKLVVVKYADKSGSVWASHPALKERESYTLKAIGSLPDASRNPPNTVAYEKFRRQLAETVIQLHMLNGQYELMTDAIDYEVARQGDSAMWHVYRGDARRSAAAHPELAAREYAWLHDSRANDALIEKFRGRAAEDLQVALEEYERAREIENGRPEALRGIGLTAQAQGDNKKAKVYLRRYLDTSAQLADRRYIEKLIARMD